MREKIEEFSYIKKDFNIEWFSGTGPGGQNRNKVQACVRITHIPSGLSTQCQSNRTRNANFSDAFGRLGKLVEVWIREQLRLQNSEGPEQGGRDETVVRSYNEPDNRVKDHASNYTIAFDEIDDKMDLLIRARKAAGIPKPPY